MVTLEQFRYLPSDATRPPACFDFHYSTPGMVAIVGDNGSGKSTLAQLMAGWYPDYLPGDIDGTGLLLGVPIGQLAGRTVAHHPVGAAVALFTAFRLYL